MKLIPGSPSSIFHWATTSRETPTHRRAAVAALLALLLPGVLCGQASREEVLQRVYPSATVQAERRFLTEDQMKRAAAVSGGEIPTALIARYIATSAGKVVGRAYVDTHVVRTKNESLLICLDETGKVKRVEVTAFLEPPEYQANSAWYGQFRDRTLTPDLNLNRAIRPIAGATLTATATTQAVRRVLAIDQVLR
jgi:electron transport complex protein RnfG